MNLRHLRLGSILGLASLLFACAELQGLDLPAITGISSGPLTESTVASGLKDALRVGTERASSDLSATGGFSDNALLRIGLPDGYARVASALRAVGLGGQVDELELSMNRAAEQAAGEAVPVFASAISDMSVSDAFEILNGQPDAATRYFEDRTSGQLRERFNPVVGGAMADVGAYQSLQDVTALYESIPLASKPAATDFTSYVTDAALSGLFATLAEEEEKIREDPAARSTALLRRVFDQSAQ